MRRTLVVLIVLAVSSTASAQIFQPGTQPVGEENGITLPIQSSRTCRMCHSAYAADDDYEPYDSWRGSMMSHAARDPVVLAALAIAEEDVPGASDFCLRCHTPNAWLGGRSSLPEYHASNPTFPERLRPDDGSLSADRDGIGCMVCHRITEPPDAAMISNAQLLLADGEAGEARRGPYEYAEGEDPRHPTILDPYLSSGALCGSCHDIHNPLHDGFRLEDGAMQPTGRRFAIERTYSEWQHSAFSARGETCQSCHMPEVAQRASDDVAFDARPEMSRHDLAGASTWQARAIAASVREHDADAAMFLERSAMRAESMLREAATVEITSSALEGDVATATVRVTNESGHKLPTGYPEGRRVWLQIEVVDATGRVVAGSGRYDDETATLERDAQLRTYEVKLGVRGEESFHFVLNDTLIEDTRIPPEGFAPPAEIDAAPLGRDYGDGAGGYRHWDEASYTLGELCGEGTLTLRARLRMQATTREYVEFLRDEAPASADPALGGRSWGQVAYDAWREHGGDEPFDMEVVEVALGASPRACPVEEIDAGVQPTMDAGTTDFEGGGGCGCRAGARSAGAGWWLALAPLVWLVTRRRAR
ncbi:hypothetical protein [Sandaracinus amylolyticus]|uniref:hypothetical protein n=1 Tax=Sandaracinus amylolyticus TaxID=927083 RepID=UPI0012ED94FC|nr:hypothetical protein [Sandaracinus amylolyticus]